VAGLAPIRHEYTFADMSRLRTLRDLCSARTSTRKIMLWLNALQRSGVRNPLAEASLVRRGSNVEFRYGGQLIDPHTLQLAFDFDAPDFQLLHLVEGSGQAATRKTTVQEMFLSAVQLEEDPKRVEEAAELYREILSVVPGHAPAAINLGTIRYNQREFQHAEELYRQATVSDPEYALAFFDLGNVLDETRRLEEAIEAYRRAVALVPHYADAHYNLALAYERQGERRRALRHWLMYARLDPVGPWATHAKCQARSILSTERLSIVSRRGHAVPIAG
jgi:tetratricopeptide (TPR) repeat protein